MDLLLLGAVQISRTQDLAMFMVTTDNRDIWPWPFSFEVVNNEHA